MLGWQTTAPSRPEPFRQCSFVATLTSLFDTLRAPASYPPSSDGALGPGKGKLQALSRCERTFKTGPAPTTIRCPLSDLTLSPGYLPSLTSQLYYISSDPKGQQLFTTFLLSRFVTSDPLRNSSQRSSCRWRHCRQR